MTVTLEPLVLSSAAQDLLFRDARTANAFSDEPVSEAQLEAIYELTKYGPTLMNSQPLRVVFVRSDEAKERLLPLMSEGNRAKTESAPVTAILAYDVDFHEQLPVVFPHLPSAKDMFAAEDRRHAVARDNAFLQAGYFIIGVRAAGLAAGPMGGFDIDGVNAEFFPEGRTKAVIVVNLGHPGENPWFGRSPRLPYEDVVTVL